MDSGTPPGTGKPLTIIGIDDRVLCEAIDRCGVNDLVLDADGVIRRDLVHVAGQDEATVSLRPRGEATAGAGRRDPCPSAGQPDGSRRGLRPTEHPGAAQQHQPGQRSGIRGDSAATKPSRKTAVGVFEQAKGAVLTGDSMAARTVLVALRFMTARTQAMPERSPARPRGSW